MKYPCELIKDLLPLYHDQACSKESIEIIEDHLLECASCKSYYDTICKGDEISLSAQNIGLELKKAESLKAIRNQIRKKQILIVIISILVLMIISFSTIKVLKNTEQIISYDNNISVAMVDDSLIGRLQGDQANHLKIKQVSITQNEADHTYLFFYLSGTKWDALTTNEEVFSEYVLCPAEKGANNIDSVFYYTGDYSKIESMNSEELQKIIDDSVLLWSR